MRNWSTFLPLLSLSFLESFLPPKFTYKCRCSTKHWLYVLVFLLLDCKVLIFAFSLSWN